ncbi:MAG: bifunctional heptose 7-phosphate kinase/heptose 1-phosphate adenyltransferase [Planctomycetota bacterium]|jgi:rfaE bifunctional protein kinase chain/domain
MSDRTAEILKKFSDCTVGVIGDMIADVYIFGRPERLSREAPVPIIQWESEEVVPGGAANTMANLLSLGAKVYPVSVVGNDSAGDALMGWFKDRKKFRREGVVVQAGYGTIVKTRVLAGDVHTAKQQVVRIDKGRPGVPKTAWDIVRGYIKEADGEVDAWVVADYGYGLLGNLARMDLGKIAKNKPVVVDSRHHIGAYGGVTIVTPNETEAAELSGMPVLPFLDDETVGEAAKTLVTKLNLQAALLTRGNRGMVLAERDFKEPFYISISGSDQIVDVSGAGDTVSAAIGLALAAGANFREAAAIANYAAGIVVMKVGTAQCGLEELTEAMGVEIIK